jgi:hypothetical protein
MKIKLDFFKISAKMPKGRTRRHSLISDDEFTEQAIQVIRKIKRGTVDVSVFR